MLEVRLNLFKLFLQASQMPKQFALHCLWRADGLARVHACLQVGIQVLIWLLRGFLSRLY